MIRRVKRIKPKKRFTPVVVADPVKTGDEREYIFLPPLTPRKKLFIITAVVLGVWVAALIVMYVTTVYPERHGHRAPSPASQPSTPATQPVPTSQPRNA
jgi:hypothetical protein